MSDSKKAHDDEIIACEICMKEIPASEAKSDEASDYVRYFCGLDCYERWSNQDSHKASNSDND